MEKVNYQKNIFPADQDGAICLDMHVHSLYSSDCNVKVQDIFKKAEELGIGIAITDHNEIQGAVEASKIVGNFPVPFIPGIEVHSAEGAHVIFYFQRIDELKRFYKEVIASSKTKDPFERLSLGFGDLVKNKNFYDCLISLPHPFVKAFTGIRSLKKEPDLYNKIDLIEVINGCVRKKANLRALDVAKKNGLGVIGGSDAHFIFEIGSSLTKCQAKNIEEFWEYLQKKSTDAAGQQANFFKTLAVSTIKETRLWKECIKSGDSLFRLRVALKTFLPYFFKNKEFKLPHPKN